MIQSELVEVLYELLELPEKEWLEFKEAKTNFDFDKLGKYFSAISNEANLKEKRHGWLIFGIEDKKRTIVGTDFRNKPSGLEILKNEVANNTNNFITFTDIYELMIDGKRVLMFQIPAASKGIPTTWNGFAFARSGESIGPLSNEEYERIRRETSKDWTGEVCEDARIEHLDEEAIKKARIEFSKKNPRLAEEMESWDNEKFLIKVKLMRNERLSNAAVILLGKEEYEYLLEPYLAKITWVLKDAEGIHEDYEHFTVPLISTVDRVFNKIRNTKYRFMSTQLTLFPLEIDKYDPFIIREALHNCIAHQDYSLKSRINIVEKPYEILFSNAGDFIPGTVENVVYSDIPPEYYRNKALADAMVSFNMIDTVGSGIAKMYRIQRKRFFPLPHYDLSEKSRVVVSIAGKVIDENYTKLLATRFDLDLKTIVLLDKVQRKEEISKEDSDFLKKKTLIEGRYPAIYISSHIAELTCEKEKYVRNQAFDKEYYKDLIVKYLKRYKKASRKNIDELLMYKLPDMLSEEQKKVRIKNIIQEMARENSIINVGKSYRYSEWVLKDE